MVGARIVAWKARNIIECSGWQQRQVSSRIQRVPGNRRNIWERGVGAVPCKKRKIRWEDTSRTARCLDSGGLSNDGGRYARDWLQTIAVDGSFKGLLGDSAARGQAFLRSYFSKVKADQHMGNVVRCRCSGEVNSMQNKRCGDCIEETLDVYPS